MLEIIENKKTYVKMAVIGVGGGGNNAINRMAEEGLEGVDLIAVNTDAQVLDLSLAQTKLQIGMKETGGMGAGQHAEVGEKSATECEDAIREILEPYRMIFVTCGMGGGTGTGAAPVIANIAKEMGILTIGVVTLPFEFEGMPRMETALSGCAKLKDTVDTLVIIPNEKLTEVFSDLSYDDAFRRADEVLHNAVRGISNIILNCGTINLDFADLCTVLRDRGMAHIGIGGSKGNDAVNDALMKAIHSPLLDTSIDGASHILLNVEGKISMNDMKTAGNTIRSLAGDKVNIFWGTVGSNKENEEVRITIIATGLNEDRQSTQTVDLGPEKSFGKTAVFSTILSSSENVEIPSFLRAKRK